MDGRGYNAADKCRGSGTCHCRGSGLRVAGGHMLVNRRQNSSEKQQTVEAQKRRTLQKCVYTLLVVIAFRLIRVIRIFSVVR